MHFLSETWALFWNFACAERCINSSPCVQNYRAAKPLLADFFAPVGAAREKLELKKSIFFLLPSSQCNDCPAIILLRAL
jgi:hypothetical protein